MLPLGRRIRPRASRPEMTHPSTSIPRTRTLQTWTSGPASTSSSRGGFVSGCQLNIHRSSYASLEQLDLDSSDATARLEKRLAFNALLLDEIKDSLGSSIEAFRRYLFASPAAFF